MVKAKDIRSVMNNIKKYKADLEKETDLLQKLKFENKIREQQYELMDVEIQLLDIELDLHKDAQLYVQIFIDKYINELTITQLAIRYNMSRTSIYRYLSRALAVFEGKRINE